MLDLYKDFIIDYGMNPRNRYNIKNYTYMEKGFNYLCGDSLILYLYIEKDCIKNISFNGVGCTISMASASLMTCMFKEKSIKSSLELFYIFKQLITNKEFKYDKYHNLNALANVNRFPSRIKCATLIWNTFFSILNHNGLY